MAIQETPQVKLDPESQVDKYDVTFYNKYDWNQSVTIRDISKEDCIVIQKTFRDQDIVTKSSKLDETLSLQINLNHISYIKYRRIENLPHIYDKEHNY